MALMALVTGACAMEPSTGSTGSAGIDAFLDETKADGHHAPKLHVEDSHELEVDEPSDLAIVSGQLYTVSDAHSKIYGVNRHGDRESELAIKGNDLEALAYDEERGEFLVADESKSRIWHIDAAGERRDPFDIDAADGNSGIEGLAFGPDGHLFVAKEKDPARIYELDAAGGVLRREKITFAADLSALAWNPEDGRLYALSDEDHALYQLDANFRAERAWRLPIEKPEGLAFDGATLYVVSDSKERLYELSFDPGE